MLFAPGFPLLRLPSEILQLISTHLYASEWARGPCLACRLLRDLELPNLSVYPATDIPGFDWTQVRVLSAFTSTAVCGGRCSGREKLRASRKAPEVSCTCRGVQQFVEVGAIALSLAELLA